MTILYAALKESPGAPFSTGGSDRSIRASWTSFGSTCTLYGSESTKGFASSAKDVMCGRRTNHSALLWDNFAVTVMTRVELFWTSDSAYLAKSSRARLAKVS